MPTFPRGSSSTARHDAVGSRVVGPPGIERRRRLHEVLNSARLQRFGSAQIPSRPELRQLSRV
jgi:hypothetical protein